MRKFDTRCLSDKLDVFNPKIINELLRTIKNMALVMDDLRHIFTGYRSRYPIGAGVEPLPQKQPDFASALDHIDMGKEKGSKEYPSLDFIKAGVGLHGCQQSLFFLKWSSHSSYYLICMRSRAAQRAGLFRRGTFLSLLQVDLPILFSYSISNTGCMAKFLP